MDTTNYAVIVDKGGDYITLVIIEHDKHGNPIPQYYDMQSGDKIITDDIQAATDMFNMGFAPRWTGSGWEATETPAITPVVVTPPDPITEIKLALAELAELIAGGE